MKHFLFSRFVVLLLTAALGVSCSEDGLEKRVRQPQDKMQAMTVALVDPAWSLGKQQVPGHGDLDIPPERVPETRSRDLREMMEKQDELVRRFVEDMHLGRPIEGYRVTEINGDTFYEDPGVLRMRLLKIYEGESQIGCVIKIENTSSHSISVNPQHFKMRGLVAASVRDMRLGPPEPADDEAAKNLPNTTVGYLVISKKGLPKQRESVDHRSTTEGAVKGTEP